MSSVAPSALVSSTPASVLVESMSHEDSAISHPRDQDYLSSKVGKGEYGGTAASTKHIGWLTYASESEKRSNASVEKLEAILKLLTSSITQTVFTSRTPPRRGHHGYTHD